MMLPDGTIIASYLGISRETRAGDDGQFTNVILRPGEVKEIVYPDDPRNVSKKFIEYNVRVDHAKGGTSTSRIYFNCVTINPMSGMADKLHFTLRPDKPTDIDHEEAELGQGSKVLLLCVNGEHNNAVIIGGLRDAANDKDNKALGHHFHFNFNGVDAAINDAGELIVQYQGKTKIDGTLDDSVDSDAPGSTLSFKKDGTIQLVDSDKQSITINRADKTIDIKADSALNINVSGPANITASENINLKSSGVNTGAATDATMMGTTFINALSELHTQSIAALTAAAAAMNGVPGGAPASTALGNFAAAIVAFEAGVMSYLSPQNKSD